ncbi:MAG: YciI family protein [Gemmatimonadota bacterium]|nr:YciI family protein [Gemmatimonadota bacterium]
MSEYVLLLHEDPTALADVSPGEIEAVIRQYVAWREGLAAEGRLAGGMKLTDEGGRWLSGANGDVRVVDGPYSEAKEVIGGLFVIKAASYDEAVEISSGCPHLAYGGRIELREVDPVD